MNNILITLVVLLAFIVLIAINWGIVSFIYFIIEKRHKRWCNSIFETHPNLKVLLSEYKRLRAEHEETVRDAVKLQKTIDEWIEKDKYAPMSRRFFTHIENLKVQYQELLDIEAEQNELVKKAREELTEFWEVNYPDLPEYKRIMWWYE